MGKSRRIHQLPADDRPREKLCIKGPAALSDFELLEVLVGTGNAGNDLGTLARQILKVLQKGTDALTLESLTIIKGVSITTAGKLLASIELSKTHLLRN